MIASPPGFVRDFGGIGRLSPAASSSYPDGMQDPLPEGEHRDRVIPKVSDAAGYKANCDAIDRLIGDCRYPYIVAWGKFLGFTPDTVMEYVQKAEADNAPTDAIQKFEDGWRVVSSIKNETNRRRVVALASISELLGRRTGDVDNAIIDPPSIKDASSAEAFVRWCVRTIGPGFHPDTPFNEYLTEFGERLFTDGEAVCLDAMADEACSFCDVYGVALDAVDFKLG